MKPWIPALALLLLAAPALAQEPRSPVGTWKTIDDDTGQAKSKVRIWIDDSAVLHGKIVYLYPREGIPENPVCEKCEGDRKDRPVLGMEIFEDLRQDEDEWSGGTVLDPENGKTYKCFLRIEDDGRLKLRGYVGAALFGRTQYWERLE